MTGLKFVTSKLSCPGLFTRYVMTRTCRLWRTESPLCRSWLWAFQPDQPQICNLDLSPTPKVKRVNWSFVVLCKLANPKLYISSYSATALWSYLLCIKRCHRTLHTFSANTWSTHKLVIISVLRDVFTWTILCVASHPSMEDFARPYYCTCV